MNNHLLTIRYGRKWYGRRLALQVDALTINRADRVIVSGENGSGKSTLLRVIAGTTTLDQGTCVRSAELREASIGYLPQEGGIYRDLTISENQKVLAGLLGSAKDKERDQIIAERLGLSAILDERVDRLSGGFRRLAAIYSLVSSGATVLILDEPFASLDTSKQSRAQETLRGVVTDYLLFLITEHTQSFPEASLWSQEVNLRLA